MEEKFSTETTKPDSEIFIKPADPKPLVEAGEKLQSDAEQKPIVEKNVTRR